MKNLHKFFCMMILGVFCYTSAFAEDVTISATLVYPEQSVIDFAKSKGWTETIKRFNPSTGVLEDIQNPTDYKTFMSRIVTDHLVKWATESKEKQIEAVALESAGNQKQQLRRVVSSALTVDVN